MKVGTVKASQIGRYNRMDAGFHLAVAEVADRVAELEALENPRSLVERLKPLPMYAKECLKPLFTGNQQRFDAATVSTAIERYPYIAFALVEKSIAEAKKIARQDVEQAEDVLNRLTQF